MERIFIMTKKEAWERFTQTGKIQDYLEYKRILRKEKK